MSSDSFDDVVVNVVWLLLSWCYMRLDGHMKLRLLNHLRILVSGFPYTPYLCYSRRCFVAVSVSVRKESLASFRSG